MTSYDFEDVQIALNAWVKAHGTERGFNSHNFKRYGFKNESGLRRHRQRDHTKTKKIIRHSQSRPKRNNGKSIDDLRPTRLIKYGNIPVTDYSFIKDRIITIGLILEWIKKHMSHIFKWDPIPDNIVEIIEEVYFNNFIIVLEPRKHGKTIALICLFAFWTIELKKTLLVLVSDWSAQKRIFYGLRHVFKKDEIRELYGDLIQSESASDFTIMYDPIYQGGSLDPFVRVASIEGSWVGSHSEWAHQEDVQQQIAVSEKTRQRMIDNYDDNLQDIADKNTGSATRKGELDYYSGLFKRGWRPLHRKSVVFTKGDFPSQKDFIFDKFEYDEQIYEDPIALTEEYLSSVEYETLNCPNYTFLTLMIRYWRNPDSFFTQFQNEAVTRRPKFFEGCEFDIIEPYQHGELVNSRYMFIDPAFSEAKIKTGSKAAMLIIVPFQNTFVIEEIIIKHMSPAQLDDWGVRLFNEFEPNESKIEDDYAQITTRGRGYTELLGLRNMGKFYNRGFGSKDQRIQTLYGYGFRGQLKIYKTAKDRVEFMRQWRSYNKDGRSGFDGLDILSSAVRILFNKFKSNGRIRNSVVV